MRIVLDVGAGIGFRTALFAAALLVSTQPVPVAAANVVAASSSSPRAPAVSSSAGSAEARSDATFSSCLSGLRARALAQGLSAQTFDRHTDALVPDPAVLERLDAQPEFRTPIWDYLAVLVDDQRIRDGRAALDEWEASLRAVERRFGVDPATVVAVWGVESDYGQRFGDRAIVRSLATLSCFGRRQQFFSGEFLASLRILDAGHFGADRFVGSWAGAFGQTQFMPSTFMRVAVDMDGDGRRDIIDSVPDALGSTANYLKRAGWRENEPWGFEVRLPPDFETARAGRRNKRPLSAWIAAGLVRADGRSIDAAALGLSKASRAAVLLPALAPASAQASTVRAPGPAFLVFRNFDALYAYNAAESYALAIAHLSDRLRGAGPFVAGWPTDDPGLGRGERRELQRRLLERGHDIGAVDGLIGTRTRAAIRVEEQGLGLPSSGRAGRRILDALRAAP